MQEVEKLPPLFILNSQSGMVSYGIQEDSPAASVLFSRHRAGWTDNDLYLKWFRDVFLPSIPTERPALLIVDGRKAVITADILEEARKNKILLLCRPEHSALLLQPLNMSLAGPLKQGFAKASAAYPEVTFDVVDRVNFVKLYKAAWCMSITPQLIQDGFRRAGIFPFNPDANGYKVDEEDKKRKLV